MAKRPLRRLPPIHDTANIAQSREAGMLAARVLEMLTPMCSPVSLPSIWTSCATTSSCMS